MDGRDGMDPIESLAGGDCVVVMNAGVLGSRGMGRPSVATVARSETGHSEEETGHSEEDEALNPPETGRDEERSG
jgi:hypothetical protein